MNILKAITRTARVFALTVAAVGITSCTDDVFNRPMGGIDSSDGNICMLYEVEGDIPLTRGIAATEHEMDLKDVYILYFDNESDADNFGKFTGYSRTTANDATTLRFDPPESVLDDHDYRLLVVGNADAYTEKGIDKLSSRLDAMLATAEKTYDITEVHKDLLAYSEEEVTSENPGVLPMCGRFVRQTDDQELVFRIKRTTEGVIIPENCIFRFQRAICRVDLHNLVGDVLDIKYVRLVNTRDHGPYFFEGINQGEFHEVTFTSDEVNPAYIEMPEAALLETGVQSKLQRLEAEMYCFPNTRNTCLPNDAETTALMIAGYYIEPDTHEKDTELTYYRFNLSNAGDAQTLQRNFCYRATIKGVRQRGYDTEEKAYNATSPIFTYDVSEEWDTDDDNVVTDQFGNFLVVNKSLLTFSGDQCGADVVKLTVNVSENMTWRLEMADEETKRWFQAEPIKGAENETIKAFTCGPREENHEQYYREGKLIIIATNSKTGSELRKEVRLVQLTTSGDVKCLIVNDYMSDFVQEVSKYGQTISYKVITGNPTNRWTARDVKGTLNGWSDNVSFTESGTNGNYFTITFPANIGENRSVDIEFKFDCGDQEANKLVKPITVTFTQDFCEQPLTIEGWPSDGELTLNCFDTRTGWETANCVAQARKFTVKLKRPDEHYFTVVSSFDKYRDLSLNDHDGSINLGNEIHSVHPELYYISEDSSNPNSYKETVNEANYNKTLTKSGDNPNFYINAFRMGPGDATIEGTITVQVKDKNDNDVPNGQLVLTVKLEVPADEYMLNDVMIKNIQSNMNTPFNNDNGWIYIMDRNIDCEARVYTNDSGKTFTNKAMWCYYNDDAYQTSNWIITGMSNQQKWIGNTTDLPAGNSNNENKGDENDRLYWKMRLKTYYNHLGKMYEEAEKYPWLPFTILTLPSIRKNTAVSKGRHFILADEEVCPINSNEKKIRVACWLPSGVHLGYAISVYPKDTFYDSLVILANRSNLTVQSFWINNNGIVSGCGSWLHLIRLMYMIGFDCDNYANKYDAYTLPASEIENQIKHYKENILQCYGPVKFE